MSISWIISGFYRSTRRQLKNGLGNARLATDGMKQPAMINAFAACVAIGSRATSAQIARLRARFAQSGLRLFVKGISIAVINAGVGHIVFVSVLEIMSRGGEMSIKAEQLKQQIIDEYKLEDDCPLEVFCHREGIYELWLKFVNINHMHMHKEAAIALGVPNCYRMVTRQHFLFGDRLKEYIEIINMAADIMAKLESGELG